MPYKTEVIITAKPNNVDKTAKQLENIDSTIDKVNKKSLNVKSVGLEGLDKMTLKELQDLMSKADTLGLGKFKGNIAQEIANRQTVAPESSQAVAQAMEIGTKSAIQGLNLKSLLGGIFGIQTLAALVAKIASQNEALSSSIKALLNGLANILKPLLDYWGGLIGYIAKALGGVAKTTSKINNSVARQVASFDEINNLTTSGGGSAKTEKSPWTVLGEEIMDNFVKMIKGALEIVGGLIATIFYGPIMLVQTGLAFVTSILGTIGSIFTGLIAGVIAGVTGFFAGIISGFKNALSQGKGVISAIFIALGNGLKNGINGFVTAFKTAFNTAFTFVRDRIVQPILDAVSNIYNKAFKPALQMILNGLGKIVNGFIGMVNSVINKVNLLPGIKLNTLNYWAVPQLAKGGLVNSGQLFIANENGAEMIGRMGNQTAVANNEQIVEGIKRGVEEAMSGRNQTITLVVDGKTLTSIVVDNIKAQSRVLGRSVI